MGLLDWLLGRKRHSEPPNPEGGHVGLEPPHDHRHLPGDPRAGRQRPSSDDQAVERYRYLLRTASPDQLEAVHAEAFARLTGEQRRQVLEAVSSELPAGARGDDPRALARAATRMEMSKPASAWAASC